VVRESEAVYETSRRGTGALVATVRVFLDEEMVEPFVEIRAVGGRRVVAVVEVLSPANKTLGSEARRTYLEKRRECLHSEAHFIEIDLLRAGIRSPLYDPVSDSDYRIVLSRVDERPRGQVWSLSLRDSLPTIPIPLTDEDPDVALDLQAVVKDIYSRARYDLEVDYFEAPPLPELTPEQESWLDELLRARGMR